ncbi:unnamed protein product [Notodromas monacha]|uniref:Uncharacterized protein n=1 Tax=Notodromas monacha TaxID=399045 RepID=A0A7R9GCS6_9CRUS|nr:unnamed protein product [Notodromas monacha]CAG0917961.1 unnamed protein product [Notodromas monacha]
MKATNLNAVALYRAFREGLDKKVQCVKGRVTVQSYTKFCEICDAAQKYLDGYLNETPCINEGEEDSASFKQLKTFILQVMEEHSMTNLKEVVAFKNEELEGAADEENVDDAEPQHSPTSSSLTSHPNTPATLSDPSAMASSSDDTDDEVVPVHFIEKPSTTSSTRQDEVSLEAVIFSERDDANTKNDPVPVDKTPSSVTAGPSSTTTDAACAESMDESSETHDANTKNDPVPDDKTPSSVTAGPSTTTDGACAESMDESCSSDSSESSETYENALQKDAAGLNMLEPMSYLALVDEKNFISNQVVPFLIGLQESGDKLSEELRKQLDGLRITLNDHTLKGPYDADPFKYTPSDTKEILECTDEHCDAMDRGCQMYRQVYEAHFKLTVALFLRLLKVDAFYKEKEGEYKLDTNNTIVPGSLRFISTGNEPDRRPDEWHQYRLVPDLVERNVKSGKIVERYHRRSTTPLDKIIDFSPISNMPLEEMHLCDGGAIPATLRLLFNIKPKKEKKKKAVKKRRVKHVKNKPALEGQRKIPLQTEGVILSSNKKSNMSSEANDISSMNEDYVSVFSDDMNKTVTEGLVLDDGTVVIEDKMECFLTFKKYYNPQYIGNFTGQGVDGNLDVLYERGSSMLPITLLSECGKYALYPQPKKNQGKDSKHQEPDLSKPWDNLSDYDEHLPITKPRIQDRSYVAVKIKRFLVNGYVTTLLAFTRNMCRKGKELLNLAFGRQLAATSEESNEAEDTSQRVKWIQKMLEDHLNLTPPPKNPLQAALGRDVKLPLENWDAVLIMNNLLKESLKDLNKNKLFDETVLVKSVHV